MTSEHLWILADGNPGIADTAWEPPARVHRGFLLLLAPFRRAA